MATQVVLFRDRKGNTPLLDWLDELPDKAVVKCRTLIERLEQEGNKLRRPEADYLEDGIYELRAKLGRVRYRMLYFFFGTAAAVITHGFAKQQSKVPAREITRAQKARAAFVASPAAHGWEEDK